MTELLTAATSEGPASTSDIDGELVCRRVVAITHDVTSFVLESPQDRRFAFQAGQYLTLSATVAGQRLERCYTISSSSTRTDQVTITVKRVAGGPMSNWLHDHLAPGDPVQVTGPLGRFSMSEHPAPRYLFLSAGSGITPLMSMTRTLHEGCDASRDVVFVHSAQSPRDIIYRGELNHIASGPNGIRVVVVCENDSPDERWAGTRGRLTLPVLQAIAPDLADREIFTCGPAAYMDVVRTILRQAGADPMRCHEESFVLGDAAGEGPAGVSAAPPAFTVEFRRSGRVIECDASTSVLQAGLRAGVILPSSCGEGVCGTCKSTLLAGQVDMRHAGGIRPREIALDKVLLCCSKPLENLVIDA